MNRLILLLSAIFFLASCQVKQTKPDGGLVSNNAPAVNAFTLIAPSAGFFKQSDQIDIRLKFPFNVTVTGSPSVALTVGSSTKNAVYLSGDGTKDLIFRYTIAALDNDVDGVAIAGAISLNGGTLKFESSPLVMTDCSLTYTGITSGVIVDTTAPAQGTVIPPSAFFYSLGQKLTFTVAYSEPVYISSGIPSINLLLGATAKNATYQSGSGTSTLTFSYTIATGDKDLNNIDITGSSLNSGVIQDAAGNAGTFSVPASAMSGVIAQDMPTIISSTAVSADATYIAGQSISFTQTFNRAMTVTGSPRIQLTVGSTTKYATYVSGSGTAALVFTYPVISPDSDSDGIAATSTIALNGGTLVDSNGDSLILNSFTPPSLAGVKVDADVPSISSLSVPSNATYLLGQAMNFTATFSSAVNVLGTPSLNFVVGSTTVNAAYVSGSGTTAILFRYTVLSGDLDTDGIAISTLALNSGTIKSFTGNNANLALPIVTTTGIQVNAVAPTLTGFTAPANATYLVGTNMDFTATFSRAMTVTGTPRVAFATTDGTKYANYLSGTGTTTLTFRYTVAANAYDYDGITITSPLDLNGGTIKDTYNYSPGLTFTVPTTTGVLVDASPALITSVAVPTSRTYGDGEILNFTFTFSKAVTVTGTPRLAITLGASTVYANYFSGSGTTALVFRKVLASPETDTDGIVMQSPLQLNSGTIKDSNTIAATLTYTVPVTTGILVDAAAPTIIAITPPANATYLTNQNLNFIVDFSETVTITGTPRLVLNVGGTTRYANYVSGSGSTSVTFRHTAVSGDTDSDGVGITSSIALNSGTILDASANPATLTFTAPNLTSVKVDAVLPVISSVTNPSNGVLTTAGLVNFTVNFNKPITVTGTPRIVISMGAATVYANYLSGSGTTALLFRYTVVSTNFDMDGLALANSNDIDLNGGTLKDAVNNTSPVNLGAQDLSGVYVTYAGLGAWFDGNDASTFTTVFSTPNYQTSNWNDKSGNAKHATQVTAGNRPYYLSAGFGTANRPYINTNVATHYMNLATAVPLIQYVITVFRTPPTMAVANVFSGTTAAVAMSATGALTFTPTAQWKVNGGTLQATTTATAASTVAINNNYIVSAKYSAGQTITTQRLGHATASMLNGRIAEILIFTSSATLTDTELTVIHNYLNTKYGIY